MSLLIDILMNFLDLILVHTVFSISPAHKVIRENKVRLHAQTAYIQCSAGFYNWEEPTCRQLLKILATLRF